MLNEKNNHCLFFSFSKCWNVWHHYSFHQCGTYVYKLVYMYLQFYVANVSSHTHIYPIWWLAGLQLTSPPQYRFDVSTQCRLCLIFVNGLWIEYEHYFVTHTIFSKLGDTVLSLCRFVWSHLASSGLVLPCLFRPCLVLPGVWRDAFSSSIKKGVHIVCIVLMCLSIFFI